MSVQTRSFLRVLECSDAALGRHAAERGEVELADGRSATLVCWGRRNVTTGSAGSATVKFGSGSHARVRKSEVLLLVDPSDRVAADAAVAVA